MFRVSVFRACLFFAAFVFTAMAAQAQERITDYNVQIDVATTGDIIVTENISVISEGRSIRRGIFRDLPRYLISPSGKKIEQDYKILFVRRGGKSETYTVSNNGNARQIRIGNADVFLQNGPHDYVIAYTVPNAMRRFEATDELYWNATGTFWKFPIERASVTVALPGEASPAQIYAYTGPSGSKGQSYTASTKAGLVTFKTTKPLAPREGITVAVALDKGVIAPLSAGQKRGQWWQENGVQSLLAALIAAVAGLYYSIWNKVGRDPAKQPVFARYHPPENYSAAACRQILLRRSSGQKALVATLMGLAHKGRITLDAQKKRTTIEKISNVAPENPALNTEEADLLARLFGKERQGYIVLDGTPNSSFVSKVSRFKNAITKRYGPTYFKGNAGLSIRGILLSIVGGVLIVIFAPGGLSGPVIGMLTALVGLNIIMPKLIAAPTKKGQALSAQIEGLKLYMETAEEGRINTAQTPDGKAGEQPPLMSTARYEELLPYAVALDVEKPWSKYFEKVMPVEARDYSPTGMTGRVTPGDLSRTTRDMVSAVSSGVASAVPPSSSSSGSSGGGSSGGGGGGGGGGGW